MLIAGAVLASCVAGIVMARQTPYVSTCLLSTIGKASGCPGFPRLVAKFSGWVAPKRLPRHEMTPAAVNLQGRVSTTDGTHPYALREVTIDFDRNLGLDARGLSACKPFLHHDPRKDLRGVCRTAVVGSGVAHFEYAFPEDRPILVRGDLIVYNAGRKDGVMTLYAVAFVDVPAPTAIVTPVEIRKIRGDRYGSRAVAKTPVIAGGSGSLLDFSLEIKRLFKYKGLQKSFVTARCPDRHLYLEISALFKNETESPGVPATTAIKGATTFPCVPAS